MHLLLSVGCNLQVLLLLLLPSAEAVGAVCVAAGDHAADAASSCASALHAHPSAPTKEAHLSFFYSNIASKWLTKKNPAQSLVRGWAPARGKHRTAMVLAPIPTVTCTLALWFTASVKARASKSRDVAPAPCLCSCFCRYVFAASKAVFTGSYDKNRRHGEGVMV